MADRIEKDLFGHEIAAVHPLPSDDAEIAHIYRAMADGEPIREVMEIFFHKFGRSHGLRSPIDELRLARKCAGGGVSRG